MFAHGVVGADQGIHPICGIAIGGPNFGAIDHKVAIGFNACVGFETGQIRAGIGLAKTLTPANFALHHGRQMLLFLRVSANFEQDWTQHPYAQVELGLAAAQFEHFSFDHASKFGCQATAAKFFGPIRGKPTFVTHFFKPNALVFVLKLNLRTTPHNFFLGNGQAHGWRAIGF